MSRAGIVSAALAGAGLVLLSLGLLGAIDSRFLVEDLAYVGTGGMGGVFCLALAAIVRVTATSAARCRDLDRIVSTLRGPDQVEVDEVIELDQEGSDRPLRMSEVVI